MGYFKYNRDCMQNSPKKLREEKADRATMRESIDEDQKSQREQGPNPSVRITAQLTDFTKYVMRMGNLDNYF